MRKYIEEISVKGKIIRVEAIKIGKNEVIVSGKNFRIARIKEEWDDDVRDPESLIGELKNSGIKIDIFTFMQRLPDSKPKYEYYIEWDNVAALPVKSYEHWLKYQIHANPRNKIKSATKKGVVVKPVEFNDELIKGIMDISNEIPIRQGKPFWDYGIDFDTVKKLWSTFLDRSFFIGAYFHNELIGYMKLVSTDRFTRTMGFLSLSKHRDKSPMNALLAKAVEFCAEKKMPYLVYAKFNYGKLGSDTLMDFKKYNGFESIILPRYYIPLTIKGRIILKFNLHHGLIGILPKKVVKKLRDLRNKWYAR